MTKSKPLGYWTFERCQEEANKYATRIELRQKAGGAYSVARRNKWLDRLFQNHKNQGRLKRQNRFWTPARLKILAKTYGTRIEMKEGTNGAYDAAVRMKLLDTIFADHPNQGFSPVKKPDGYWTPENLQAEALKYRTRSEFRSQANGAYLTAHKRGVIDEICAHMEKIGSKYERAIYAIKAKNERIVYIGLSQNPDRRYRDHKRSGTPLVRDLLSMPHEFVLLTDFLPKDEASDRERELVEEYRSAGWELRNVMRGGSLGGMERKWALAELEAEVAKFTTRGEFLKESSAAYQAAHSRELLDQLFANHPNQGYQEDRLPPGSWTLSALAAEAAKYETRGEFSKKAQSAYVIAVRQGVIDEIFKDHPNRGRKNRGYRVFTFEKCQEIVSGCQTRKELQNKDGYVYKLAREKGWLDDLFGEHPYLGYESEAKMIRYQK